jgi:hypothetical protein
VVIFVPLARCNKLIATPAKAVFPSPYTVPVNSPEVGWQGILLQQKQLSNIKTLLNAILQNKL